MAAPATYSKHEKLTRSWLKTCSTYLDKGDYNGGLQFILPKLKATQRNPVMNPKKPKDEFIELSRDILKYFITFLARADLTVVEDRYHEISRTKPSFAPLLDITGFTNAGPRELAREFGGLKPDDEFEVVRFLCLITLTTIHHYLHNVIDRLEPKLLGPLIFGCCSQKYTCTTEKEHNRLWLTTRTDLINRLDFNQYDDYGILASWMTCSYLDLPQKHQYKAACNRMIIRWLERSKLIKALPSVSKKIKKRPTILIIAESFSPSHAMFRCHGQSTAALKNSFHSVLMADSKTIDDNVKSLFNDVIHLKVAGTNIKHTIKKIRKCAPDVIYYPSVGMSPATIALCNMRLAKVQFMSMGHPASTFSNVMDYVVVNNDLRPDSACFSEKLIHRSISNGYSAHPAWDRDNTTEGIPLKKRKKIRVGILGFMPKLTNSFLRMCKKLQEESNRPLEFHFFPNDNTNQLQGLQVEIKQTIQGARIHPRSNYTIYMNNVNRMDLILSTAPFGNTNGTIDSLILNKPIITLEGPEPHAKTDARLLRKLGAPREMITKSKLEYFQTAQRWLKNPEKLLDLSAQLSRLDVEGTFFKNQTSDLDEIATLLYLLHEELQKDERVEFKYDDLLKIKAAKQTHS